MDKYSKPEQSERTSTQSQSKSSYSLSNGTYKVGKDIAAGTYNFKATSGYGLISGDFASGFLSMTIGISDDFPDNRTYNNLVLTQGDEFKIINGVTIEFTSK